MSQFARTEFCDILEDVYGLSLAKLLIFLRVKNNEKRCGRSDFTGTLFSD